MRKILSMLVLSLGVNLIAEIATLEEYIKQYPVFNKEQYNKDAMSKAKEKYKVYKKGDEVNITTKYNGVFIGEYYGLHNDKVFIGAREIDLNLLPNDIKPLFEAKLASKLRTKFISDYISEKKVLYENKKNSAINSFEDKTKDTLTITTLGGKVYKDVTVIGTSKVFLNFTHSSGIAKVDFNNLSKEIQEKYNYNPHLAKDKRIELKRKEDILMVNAQFKRLEKKMLKLKESLVDYTKEGRIINKHIVSKTSKPRTTIGRGSDPSFFKSKKARTSYKTISRIEDVVENDYHAAIYYKYAMYKMQYNKTQDVIKVLTIAKCYGYEITENTWGNAYKILGFQSSRMLKWIEAAKYLNKALDFLGEDIEIAKELVRFSVDLEKAKKTKALNNLAHATNNKAYAIRDQTSSMQETEREKIRSINQQTRAIERLSN